MNKVLLNLLFLALNAAAAQSTVAAQVNYWFSGQVTRVMNPSNALPFEVTEGMPFTGRVLYDTALVAQTFLVMYLLMYAAVVHLRRTQPDAPRPFRIPGGRIGLVVIVGIGVTGSVFTFILGFIPASHLSVEGTVVYVLAMVVGIAAVCGTPFLLHRDQASEVGPPSTPAPSPEIESDEALPADTPS